MDDADERRRRWIDVRQLTNDQYMLVNFAHCHAEWQDNVDTARRDEMKERVMRAAHTGLLSEAVARGMLERLAADEEPTTLEVEAQAAGVPDIHIPRNSPNPRGLAHWMRRIFPKASFRG
jgi:hypothetical protein